MKIFVAGYDLNGVFALSLGKVGLDEVCSIADLTSSRSSDVNLLNLD